ncbi:MAG: hypothetical protein HRT74_02695 [Flavobacteriales bacterium]|nr:hypothetical protein [Flavobacteriales bacterium]
MKHWFLAGIIILLLGCRKEGDTQPPSVTLVQPQSEFTFLNFGETLQIAANFSDNESLSKYILTVQGETTGEFFVSTSGELNGTKDDFAQLFVFEDVQLPSDEYLIRITVEDEAGNQASDFSTVQLFEAPKVLENIGVIQSESTSNLWILQDDDWQSQGNYSFNATPAFMGSFHQELLLGEENSGNIHRITPENWSGDGLLNFGETLAEDFINDVYFYDKAYFLSLFSGQIVKLNANLMQSMSFDLPDNFRPEQVVATEDAIVVEAVQIGTGSRLLMSFNPFTGVFQGSTNVEFDVVQLLPFEGNFAVFGATAMGFFNTSGNTFSEQNLYVSSEPVSDVVIADFGLYSVAHGDGVYHYRLGDNVIIFPSDNISIKSLSFDPVVGVTYGLSNSGVHTFSILNGNLLQTWNTPVEMDHLFLHFNK